MKPIGMSNNRQRILYYRPACTCPPDDYYEAAGGFNCSHCNKPLTRLTESMAAVYSRSVVTDVPFGTRKRT